MTNRPPVFHHANITHTTRVDHETIDVPSPGIDAGLMQIVAQSYFGSEHGTPPCKHLSANTRLSCALSERAQSHALCGVKSPACHSGLAASASGTEAAILISSASGKLSLITQYENGLPDDASFGTGDILVP